MWWGSVSLMSCAQHALGNPLHWPLFWVRGKENQGNVEICLSHSVVALKQECRARWSELWLTCPAARSVGDLRLALSRALYITRSGRSATFFSRTKTGKRLQDLQAAVGQQLALPMVLFIRHKTMCRPLPVPSSPSQLLCYLLEPRNTGTFSCNQPRFPGHYEGTWHYYPSASSFRSLN